MTVTAEVYRDLMEAAAAEPPLTGANDLEPLQSIDQVLSFAFRRFCDEGDVESALDMTECLVRSLDLDAPAVRRIEATLRPLGFVELADRLRQTAGRRKHDLRPLR